MKYFKVSCKRNYLSTSLDYKDIEIRNILWQRLNSFIYIDILGYQGASRPSFILIFNCCSIFQYFLFDKTKMKKFAKLKFCFRGISKFLETTFWNSENPSSISTLNCGFICEHLLFVQYKIETSKKFSDLIIFFFLNSDVKHKILAQSFQL